MRFFSPYFLLLAASLPSAILYGAEAARPNYDESKVLPYTLHDPLRSEDGTSVRDVATWRNRRRPELLNLFSSEVYGRTPASRPNEMHWEVTSVDRAALGGKAVRKQLTIWFTAKKDGPKMHLLVYKPSGAGAPWPVFLGLNYFGNQC